MIVQYIMKLMLAVYQKNNPKIEYSSEMFDFRMLFLFLYGLRPLNHWILIEFYPSFVIQTKTGQPVLDSRSNWNLKCPSEIELNLENKKKLDNRHSSGRKDIFKILILFW